MTALLNEQHLVDGFRIAAGRHGPEDGAPVLMLHGTPASSILWRAIAPRLADRGYRVHLFDLLGFGASERPRDEAIDTSVTAQRPIAEALLARWGVERFHLVGHDIGGAIAMQLGALAPERLASLTLIDVVSFDSWPSPTWRARIETGLDALIAASDSDHRANFGAQLMTAVHDEAAFERGAFPVLLDLISGPVGQASFFQHQVRHYDSKHTQDWTDRLHRLGKVPTSILWGAEDVWQIPSWGETLRAAIPGSTLQLFENCGHFAMEDDPDAIGAAILAHVESAPM